jgi:hypothetical protein
VITFPESSGKKKTGKGRKGEKNVKVAGQDREQSKPWTMRLAVNTVENAKSQADYCYPSMFREMKTVLGLETPFVISAARRVMDLSFRDGSIRIKVGTTILSIYVIFLFIAFEFAGRGGPPIGEHYLFNIRRIQKTESGRTSPLALALYTASQY